MEKLSDDDAKKLASGWVKRIQNSLLAPDSDVTSLGNVSSRIRSSDEPNSRVDLENGKVHDHNLGSSPVLADSGINVSSDMFSGHSGVSTNWNHNDSSFQNTFEHSNILVDPSSEPNGLATARPDANFLRRKRLEFFNKSKELQEKGDFTGLPDRNHNLHVKESCAKSAQSLQKNQWEVEQLDCNQDIYANHKPAGNMHQLEAFQKPLSQFLNGCASSNELQPTHRTANGFESDEDEFRLELWGLKESINSGEVNLNAYLSESSWKGKRSIPASQCQFDNFVDEPTRYTCTPVQPLQKESDSKDYNQSRICASEEFGNEMQKDDNSHSHLNRKTLAQEICNGHFSGPEPQINGPLYCGFDNSDSETSLLSFGSKCDDVHYRKLEEMSPRGRSNHLENKNKPKRSKDQILLELTEFIEVFGSPKDSTKIGDVKDRQLRCSSDKTLPLSTEKVFNGCTEDSKRNQFGKISGYRYSPGEFICRSQSDPENIELSSNQQGKGNTSLPSEHHKNVMGKICPSCDEVNSKAANWCIECGKALVSVEPTCLTAKQQKVFEKQCEETKVLIAEALKTPMNFSHLLSLEKAEEEERLLNKGISNLSLRVSQSTKNFEEEKYNCLSKPHEYKRRWVRSSIAWSTYHPSELTKSRSFVNGKGKTHERQRATSFSDVTSVSNSKGKEKGSKHKKANIRSKSARKRTVSCCSLSGDGPKVADGDDKGFTNLKSVAHHQNASSRTNQRGRQVQSFVKQNNDSSRESQHHSRPPHHDSLPKVELNFSRCRGGELIGESILLHVAARCCWLRSVDASWTNVSDCGVQALVDNVKSFRGKSCRLECLCLNGCQAVSDKFIKSMATKHGNNLRIFEVFGCFNITPSGIKLLGQSCKKLQTLNIGQCHKELNFSRCRGGELIGESILLHVAARCCWLRSVDASWTNVSDCGVQALVDNVKRLECLCLNGCQAVSDKFIKSMATKHGNNLRIFEVFGCFNITPSGIKLLGQSCKKLQTLNIGQCHKMTDSAIGGLVSNLPELENLDLRGCKQIRDSAVRKIVKYCPLVTTLVLANCPLITDVSLKEIATNLPRIRYFYYCKDEGKSSEGSSSRAFCVLHVSVSFIFAKIKRLLAVYCTYASSCLSSQRLNTLHLYGCKRIRNTSDLRLLNPALSIEC
ncbi:PREDICTED: uncharacterized protein LOC107336986 [Acropora digitifera]|uniref:uncharacterized protein LOC107336986 n=1 Tax=Acropora digitifera TaxID=70779 RepID=UPI00077A3138|nr:PREDICTED: uncharacterized protein LOC107336986 [Acropora digitifera]